MLPLASESLTGIPVLVRVAETESFSQAARQLGMTPSGVSKAISRLEERVGVRLFDRSTRRVALTEEGLRFYERCRQIVADIEEAQIELTEARVRPRGTLVVTAPTSLGRSHIVPALPEFLLRHPDVEVQLQLTDRRVDLIGERVDVAVRIGEDISSEHGRLVHHVIAQSRAVVCASPRYVQRYGEPRAPEDLAEHNVYFYGERRASTGQTWQFHRSEERRAVPLRGNVTLDSGDALVELARHGEGVIAVFDFLAMPALCAGDLQRLLPDWQVWQSLSISLVYPKHRRLSPKVTTFATFIGEIVAGALGI